MGKISNGLGFIVESEGIYKVLPLSLAHPEEHVYELVLDKETFVEAYKKWIEQGDTE